MKWLILPERNNRTIKSKRVLETGGNVAEINTAQALETEGMKYCGVHGKFSFAAALKAQSLETLISFSVSESGRRYMPGKTAWVFGVISRDLVS